MIIEGRDYERAAPEHFGLRVIKSNGIYWQYFWQCNRWLTMSPLDGIVYAFKRKKDMVRFIVEINPPS